MSHSAKRYKKTRKPEAEIVNLKAYRQKKILNISPRNKEQAVYLDLLENEDNHIIVAYGPAGTGKSFLACLFAVEQLTKGNVDKIVVTRPNLATDDKDIGYLKGDLLEKMAPWIAPITDAFLELGYMKNEIVQMMDRGVIEIVPIAYIRGRTFRNSIIIGDETQNLTKKSMLALLTRIGDGSKMILTGDINQSDRDDHNGLHELIDRVGNAKGIAVLELTHVERHPVIAEVIKIFEE